MMYLKREDGTAAVEFAILLPLLMLILFGIIEFGFILYNVAVVTNASREGARYGIVMVDPKHSSDEIEGVVNAYIEDRLIRATATPRVAGANGPSGGDLTVSVDLTYDFLVLPNFVTGLGEDGSLKVTATSVMKME
jgi:Flp pilus assembly protein TadG